MLWGGDSLGTVRMSVGWIFDGFVVYYASLDDVKIPSVDSETRSIAFVILNVYNYHFWCNAVSCSSCRE